MGTSRTLAGEEPDADEKRIEVAAVRLLARREHGTDELRRKLRAKGYEAASVGRVVEKLEAKCLVSDDRFVVGFVQHHARRGQGPIKIRAELRQQGIAEELIERVLADAELDWNELAVEARQRKFGPAGASDLRSRAKQTRFLQYRGFTADQIRAALAAESEGQAPTDPSESLDSDWPD